MELGEPLIFPLKAPRLSAHGSGAGRRRTAEGRAEKDGRENRMSRAALRRYLSGNEPGPFRYFYARLEAFKPCPTRGAQRRTRRHANQTAGSAPVGAPRHLVAPPRLFVPFGRIRRIAERRPDINSTTRVENEMIRFAIAMFLLLLFGVAVEELAVRSAGALRTEATATMIDGSHSPSLGG